MWHNGKKKEGHSCCGHMHGDIMCVQQDTRLRYHRSDNDHYCISHTVAQTAPLRPLTMGLNAK